MRLYRSWYEDHNVGTSTDVCIAVIGVDSIGTNGVKVDVVGCVRLILVQAMVHHFSIARAKDSTNGRTRCLRHYSDVINEWKVTSYIATNQKK
jgi:hypothetical protein